MTRAGYSQSLWLSQRHGLVTGPSDVDQCVPVPATGADEVDPRIVNLGGHSLEHDRKAAAPTSPHESDANSQAVRMSTSNGGETIDTEMRQQETLELIEVCAVALIVAGFGTWFVWANWAVITVVFR